SGGTYPFAPVGTTLPGEVTIRKAKIRGEVSEGMLCSARELGLGHDHAGILDLPEGLTPGMRLLDAFALDDWRFDVEVTANRGDLLSHLGLARELAPGGEAALVLPPVQGGAGAAAAVASIVLVTDPAEAGTPATRVRVE